MPEFVLWIALTYSIAKIELGLLSRAKTASILQSRFVFCIYFIIAFSLASGKDFPFLVQF